MKLGDNRIMGVDWGDTRCLSAIVVADLSHGGRVTLVHLETFEASSRMEFDARVARAAEAFGRHDDQVDALAYALGGTMRPAPFITRYFAHRSLKRRAREQRRLDWASNVRRRKRAAELALRRSSVPSKLASAWIAWTSFSGGS